MDFVPQSPRHVLHPEIKLSPRTPELSAHGHHANSPSDRVSSPTRKSLANTLRVAKSLRLKLSRNSELLEKNESRRRPSRRKSISSLFGSTSTKSRRGSRGAWSEDESSVGTSIKITSSAKTGEFDDNSRPQTGKRKSLSALFGTISQKLSPKRSPLHCKDRTFVQDSSHHRNENCFERHEQDNQTVLPTLSDGSLMSVAQPNQLSFEARLAEIATDLKEHQMGSRHSSIGSTSTLAPSAPAYISNVTQTHWDCDTEDNRIGTPDSYLQLLIESHDLQTIAQRSHSSRTYTSDTHTQAPVDSHDSDIASLKPISSGKNTSIAYLRPRIEVQDSPSKSRAPTPSNRATPDSYLQLLVESSEYHRIVSPRLTPTRADTPDSYLQLLIQSQSPMCDEPSPVQDCPNKSPSLSPLKCKPTEPVDFLANSCRRNTKYESWVEDIKNDDVVDLNKIPHSGGKTTTLQRSSIPDVSVSRDDNEICLTDQIRSQKLETFLPKMPENVQTLFERTTEQNIGLPSSTPGACLSEIGISQQRRRNIQSGNNKRSMTASQDPPGVISYVSTDFDPKEYEARLTDALTTILPSRYGTLHLQNHEPNSWLCEGQKEYDSDQLDFVRRLEQTSKGSSPETKSLNQQMTWQHNEKSRSMERTDDTRLPVAGKVQVQYPTTSRRYTRVENYESAIEAVTAILDHENYELSEYALFDPQSRTIYARLLEAEIPIVKDQRQYGYEVLWLPEYSRITATATKVYDMHHGSDIKAQSQNTFSNQTKSLHSAFDCDVSSSHCGAFSTEFARLSILEQGIVSLEEAISKTEFLRSSNKRSMRQQSLVKQTVPKSSNDHNNEWTKWQERSMYDDYAFSHLQMPSRPALPCDASSSFSGDESDASNNVDSLGGETPRAKTHRSLSARSDMLTSSASSSTEIYENLSLESSQNSSDLVPQQEFIESESGSDADSSIRDRRRRTFELTSFLRDNEQDFSVTGDTSVSSSVEDAAERLSREYGRLGMNEQSRPGTVERVVKNDYSSTEGIAAQHKDSMSIASNDTFESLGFAQSATMSVEKDWERVSKLNMCLSPGIQTSETRPDESSPMNSMPGVGNKIQSDVISRVSSSAQSTTHSLEWRSGFHFSQYGDSNGKSMTSACSSTLDVSVATDTASEPQGYGHNFQTCLHPVHQQHSSQTTPQPREQQPPPQPYLLIDYINQQAQRKKVPHTSPPKHNVSSSIVGFLQARGSLSTAYGSLVSPLVPSSPSRSNIPAAPARQISGTSDPDTVASSLEEAIPYLL